MDKISQIRAPLKTRRRAMTKEEIMRLLNVCDPKRRLLYEMAICTGLRAGELDHLKVKNIDLHNGEVILEEAWTKNHKQGMQPIPKWLVEKLRIEIAGKGPDDKVLEVPTHTARELNKELEKAHIPKTTDEGKVDFHAFRVVYITSLLEVGKANPLEAKELARHSTLELTMNVYGRTRKENLKEIIENIGESYNGLSNIVEDNKFNFEKNQVTGRSQIENCEIEGEGKTNKIRLLSGKENISGRLDSNQRPSYSRSRRATRLRYAPNSVNRVKSYLQLLIPSRL